MGSVSLHGAMRRAVAGPLACSAVSLRGVNVGTIEISANCLAIPISSGGRGGIRTHEGAKTPCRFSRPVP